MPVVAGCYIGSAQWLVEKYGITGGRNKKGRGYLLFNKGGDQLEFGAVLTISRHSAFALAGCH